MLIMNLELRDSNGLTGINEIDSRCYSMLNFPLALILTGLVDGPVGYLTLRHPIAGHIEVLSGIPQPTISVSY